MQKYKDCTLDKDATIEKRRGWNPLSKQLVIGSSIWTYFFMNGLCVGTPTVLIPQIRREANSSDAVSMEMASWLSSMTSYGGVPGILILSVLAYYIGRKPTCIFLSFSTLLGFIILYCSTTVTQILISEIIQGFLAGSTVSTSVLVITEYTSPRYRGTLMGFKPCTLFFGIWMSNAIGTFFHWRNIGLIGLFCSVYNTLVVLFVWPESPYWLSVRGRFDECVTAHRWLKGCNAESEKELSNLLKLGRLEEKKSKLTTQQQLNMFFKTMLLKEVYKPMLLTLLLIILFVFSGKYVFAVYSLDILKKITNSEATAYAGMLILDGITVFSMYIGCTFIKFIKRRTLLLVATFIGTTFLYIISLYLYLIKLSIIIENKFVSLVLLSGFSLAIGCGPMLMSGAMFGEFVPIKFRATCMCIAAITGKFILATVLKISPYLFQSFQFYGTFLLFAVCCSVCFIFAYKYLVETQNKTLIEISQSFTNAIPDTDEAEQCLSTRIGYP